MIKMPFSLLKMTYFLCLFMSSSFLFFAQNNHGHVKILPKWQVNDFRNIHVEITNRTTIGDSVIRSDQRAYDILFKVIEISDHILVRWTCMNDDEIIRCNSPWDAPDEIQTRLIQSLENIKRDLFRSELILKLNKETGKAEEWVDGMKKLKDAEFQEKKDIREWCNIHNIAAETRENMEVDFSKVISSDYENWRKSILGRVNMLFEQYNKTFSLQKETTETIFTTDLLAEKNQEADFPAICTRTASESGNRLTLQNVIDYDKKFLILYLQKNHEYLENLNVDNVLVVEKEKAIFDIMNSWIVSYSKTLSFEVKEIRTVALTEITFH